MIKSVTRPVIKSIVRSPLGGYIQQLIRRYFTTFDSVAQSYIELSSPITLTGDFEVEFYSQIPSNGGYILGSRATTNGTDRLLFTSDGYLYGFGFGGSTVFAGLNKDSTLYKFVITRTAGSTTLTVGGLSDTVMSGSITIDSIGSQFGGSTTIPYMDGIISDLKIWDGADRTTGNLVLDMPLNQKFSSLSRYAQNKASNIKAATVSRNPIDWELKDGGSIEVEGNYFKITSNTEGLKGYVRIAIPMPAGSTVIMPAKTQVFGSAGGEGWVTDPLKSMPFAGNTTFVSNNAASPDYLYVHLRCNGTTAGSYVLLEIPEILYIEPEDNPVGVIYNAVADDVEEFVESNNLLISTEEAWSGEGVLPKHGIAGDSSNSSSNYVLTLIRTNELEGDLRWAGVMFDGLDADSDYSFDINVQRNDVPNQLEIAGSTTTPLVNGENTGVISSDSNGRVYLRLRMGTNGDTAIMKVSLKRALDSYR